MMLPRRNNGACFTLFHNYVSKFKFLNFSVILSSMFQVLHPVTPIRKAKNIKLGRCLHHRMWAVDSALKLTHGAWVANGTT
jgi:hypothetical protein